MSDAWAGGSTRAWRALRAQVLAAAGYRCKLDVGTMCPKHGRPCPDVCTKRANTAHHTRGRAVTGDDPRFVIAACTECNLHVGEPPRPANTRAPKPVTWF